MHIICSRSPLGERGLKSKHNGEVKRLSLFKLDSYAKEFIGDYFDLNK